MAGVYAGIPGPLAILTMTPRGLIRRQASEGIALDAWIGLCVFAAIGGMLGWNCRTDRRCGRPRGDSRRVGREPTVMCPGNNNQDSSAFVP